MAQILRFNSAKTQNFPGTVTLNPLSCRGLMSFARLPLMYMLTPMKTAGSILLSYFETWMAVKRNYSITRNFC